jgi:flagellar assembly protein FliH
VQHVAADAKSVRDRVLMHAEREIVELVIGAVHTVLGEQVRLDSSLVLDTVERALSRAGSLNVVRIRVNPADHEVVATGLLSRIGDTAAGWSVTADGAIGVGGCIIDTAAGEIDARLDAQLGEVARALREALPDAGTTDAHIGAAASLFDEGNGEWRHVA